MYYGQPRRDGEEMNKRTVYRLVDICDIKSGKRIPKGMDYVEYPTEYPYIRARDIKDGRIKTDSLIYLEKPVYEKIKRYIINSGDIAITIVGASVGDVGYADDSVDGYNLTENAVRLTHFDKSINGRYLFYMLYQKQYHDYMQLVAGAAAQPKLGIYKVERIKVSMPDREEQDRVVEVLSSYDHLININNKKIEMLEALVEKYYTSWFVLFKYPGNNQAEFLEQNPKGWILKSCKNMKIPKDWHYGELQELGEFIRGKNITAAEMIDGDIPVISAGLQPSGYHNEANVFGDSLTVSASGANAGFLKYNLNDVWAADCSYYQHENNLWFIYSSLRFLQPVISNLQCGAAQPHVYPKHLNRLQILIPSQHIIEGYCNLVSPIFENIRLLQRRNKLLESQRDMLIPRLMGGKIKI